VGGAETCCAWGEKLRGALREKLFEERVFEPEGESLGGCLAILRSSATDMARALAGRWDLWVSACVHAGAWDLWTRFLADDAHDE
jgi:hypothetical protein